MKTNYSDHLTAQSALNEKETIPLISILNLSRFLPVFARKALSEGWISLKMLVASVQVSTFLR